MASWKLLIYAGFALFLLDFDVLFGFTFFLCFQLASVFNIHHFGMRLWFLVRDFRSSVVEVYIAFAWFWIYYIFHLELACLCNFMARIPDKIKSIDGSKETLKLAVRITDLLFVGTPNKSEQVEMVFVDSEGDQIHAVCKSDHLKSWKADLKENSTYVMHNFKVVKNDGQFRVCEHEYKLFFIGVTVVREADLHELPFKEFRFVEFANVVAGNFVAGLLVDIIGVVDQVVFRRVSSKNTRVVFRMKDLSGEILSCTLWENYCMQFLSYLNERGNDGSMVIILAHAKIKDAQGSYPASVSNSFKVSKLLINDPILEIQEFKERLLDLGVEVSPVLLFGDQASLQVSGGSQVSSKDSFLSKAEVKSIFEINSISEDVVCVTVGTISKIVMDNHSWCYPACLQCHRKTDIQTGPFTCGCGKDNDQPDRECAKLIGQTADDVNRVKIEDGDLDLNASPQSLDRLLGHVLAFKVRIQSKFKNVVVLRYSNELDLINVVLEMLADSEACSKIDPSNVDCNNATHAECQSLSVTADHDPVAGFPLTPKKRMSSDEVDDELGSSQISPAQLSTINMQRDLILQKLGSTENKRHAHPQSSSQATVNRTSEYDSSGSNFMTAYEDCQSPTNQPVINTEGYSDLGDQLIQCRYCNAQMWYDERISKDKNCQNPRFSLCCGDGKVELPLLQNPPQYLQRLLFHDDTIDSKNYQHNLRAYNMMFAFTSAGIKLDKTINNSRGPPTIRIQGQPCHRIGSLLPMPGKKKPKFAQLYIFDTENEVQNKINAMSQYSGIQSHIVSGLSHMLDQHNSHAKSFRMARDRLAGDQANNIKLQLIAARGKDGRVYNMPNVPEIAALIVGDFHPGSKRDIIVETQNGELQRIHELHASYPPLQYSLLFPYGEDEYRADILHRSTSSSKKRKRNRLTMREWFAYRLQSRSNEAHTLLHSRKLFQQFIVEGYTMVESKRLSYIRNNQKKLRVDKLTKGKKVILPSTFVGSPRYMDQLYFDGMAICSHVGFPNLFITLTCNPNWPKICRLLSPLNLKPTDRPDFVSRIFILKYEHMLSDLTKGQLLGKVVAYMHTIEFQKRGLPHINDDTLRNLTLIEIEQLLHINQRSLKDYPTMPYPQDINLTSYLQNNLVLSELDYNHDAMRSEFELNMQYPSRDPISRITEPDKMSMSPSQSPWLFKLLRRQFPIMLSYEMTINKSQGQSLSMVGLYFPKPVFTHGQLYVALSRVNSAKGLKILIHDDEQKSMNSTTNTFIEIPPFYHEQWAPNYPQEVRFKYNGATYPIRVQQHRGRYFFADGLADFKADLKIYESIIINFFACDDNTIFYLHFTPPLNQQTCGRPILHSRQHIWTTEITQCILGAPQPLEISSHARKYLKECDNHLTILRKNAPPLQWDVVTLDHDIKDKSIFRSWYKFLKENDFHHGDEV
ncbi:Replication protein A DNA-binding subunit C [Glycine soja]